MKKGSAFFWKLFLSTFSLSAFTFGGGYVMIPLMRRKFVAKYHWLEEHEMLDLTAIAQAAPGAMAVNASILIGYRLAGILGAMITVLGTILPPLIILSVVSVGYIAFKNSQPVAHALRGMQAGVAAVIIDVVMTMSLNILHKKQILSIVVMLLAFIAASVFDVNVVLIILACGILGALSAGIGKQGERKAER